MKPIYKKTQARVPALHANDFIFVLERKSDKLKHRTITAAGQGNCDIYIPTGDRLKSLPSVPN